MLKKIIFILIYQTFLLHISSFIIKLGHKEQFKLSIFKGSFGINEMLVPEQLIHVNDDGISGRIVIGFLEQSSHSIIDGNCGKEVN